MNLKQFVSIVICLVVVSHLTAQTPGVYKAIAGSDAAGMKDASVAAKFALDEEYKLRKNYTLTKILAAERKDAVEGTSFRLCVDVNGPIEEARDDGRRTIQTVVFRNSKNTYELYSWTWVKKCGERVPNDDTPNGFDLASFVDQLPSKSEHTPSDLALAQSNINANRYDSAIAHLTAYIKADPKVSRAFAMRGAVYSALGKQDLAAADIKTAIALDPRNADAYMTRGAIAYANGDHAACIADSTRAIELDPKLTNAYFNRGTSHLILKHWDEALADLNKTLQIDPKFAPALANRAIVWDQRDDLEHAIDDLNNALFLDSNNKGAQTNMSSFVNKASYQLIISMVNPRAKDLNEKINARTAKGQVLLALDPATTSDATYCRTLAEITSLLSAEDRAVHQLTFVNYSRDPRLAGYPASYKSVLEAIVENKTTLAGYKADHKCK
jgi:tetratricopeptide (TPR) repeat protein